MDKKIETECLKLIKGVNKLYELSVWGCDEDRGNTDREACHVHTLREMYLILKDLVNDAADCKDLIYKEEK